MRFKLHLQKVGTGNRLPINYQYELSAWIYKTLQSGDAAFSEWLHQNGYTVAGKQFRLFTFSQLFFPKNGYRVQGDRLLIQSRDCWLEVGLMVDEAAQHFVLGIFKNQRLGIGDIKSVVDFEVKSVERLSVKRWEDSNRFRCLSPMCVAVRTIYNGKESQTYLSPTDEGYGEFLHKNLLNKWRAYQKNARPSLVESMESLPFEFRLLSSVKSRLVKIKAGTRQETKVRGFLFDFELVAPLELLEVGYACGFGEKNAMGFGCVGRVEQSKNPPF